MEEVKVTVKEEKLDGHKRRYSLIQHFQNDEDHVVEAKSQKEVFSLLSAHSVSAFSNKTSIKIVDKTESGFVEKRFPKLCVASFSAEIYDEDLQKKGLMAAEKFLRGKGYVDVEKYTCSDYAKEKLPTLTAVDPEDDTLVFVTVKTRRSSDVGFPEESTDEKERHRIECIAENYLKTHDAIDVGIRFDVICLIVLANEKAFLRHHRSAFLP